MCYVNAYLPTVNSPEYQANETLVTISPSATAQVQMFTEIGTLFWSDAATLHTQMVEDWVFNGPCESHLRRCPGFPGRVSG